MSRNSLIYSYPLLVDIAVGLMLFVGRHGLASRGYDESIVGAVLLVYGVGYCLASVFMRRVIRVAQARGQMTLALAVVVACCGWLAGTRSVFQILVVFAVVPVAFSLFFNAFQAFMLDLADSGAKPLAATVGHYTFSWSLGYALGPFVSGACGRYLVWEQIYWVAAGLAGVVGGMAWTVRPRLLRASGEVQAIQRPPGEPSLMGAAWLGLVVAWAGWHAVSSYWPVQAQQLGFGPGARSGVEFGFALSQACSALALAYLGKWHHRRGWLLGFGLLGMIALGLLAGAQELPRFVGGAVLYGVFTSSAFSFMVYHAMYEPQRAVRRVALNETFVGLGFLVGPVVAGVLHTGSTSFYTAYMLLTGCVGMGVLAQLHYARVLQQRP